MNTEDCFVFTPKALDEAGEGDVCFTRDWWQVDTKAIVIGPKPKPAVENYIESDDPRASMNEVMRYWLSFADEPPGDVGISPFAVITEHVTMGKNVYIGSGCVIGEDGFAYDRIDGKLKRFPHLGKVILGDNVEVEANTHIARGSLKDTVLCDGVKVDANVHIAHNVFIDEDTMVTAGVTIGGSARIGKRVWVGLNAIIRDGITIGDDAFIGMGSVVVRDVPPNVTVMGNPARVR